MELCEQDIDFFVLDVENVLLAREKFVSLDPLSPCLNGAGQLYQQAWAS